MGMGESDGPKCSLSVLPPRKHQTGTNIQQIARRETGSFDGIRKRIRKASEMEYGSLRCQRNTGLRDAPGT